MKWCKTIFSCSFPFSEILACIRERDHSETLRNTTGARQMWKRAPLWSSRETTLPLWCEYLFFSFFFFFCEYAYYYSMTVFGVRLDHVICVVLHDILKHILWGTRNLCCDQCDFIYNTILITVDENNSNLVQGFPYNTPDC